MSQIETIIRYDGPDLAGHEMNVDELAPALIALASLIQSANHKFNGDRSAVRVLVNADIEQKCFQLKIKLVQDILQHAKSFLDGDMATIKDICEWVGIIGGSGFSLFKLLVMLGRKQGFNGVQCVAIGGCHRASNPKSQGTPCGIFEVRPSGRCFGTASKLTPKCPMTLSSSSKRTS